MTAEKDVQVARKKGRGGGEVIWAMPERKHFFFMRCSLRGGHGSGDANVCQMFCCPSVLNIFWLQRPSWRAPPVSLLIVMSQWLSWILTNEDLGFSFQQWKLVKSGVIQEHMSKTHKAINYLFAGQWTFTVGKPESTEGLVDPDL